MQGSIVPSLDLRYLGLKLSQVQLHSARAINETTTSLLGHAQDLARGCLRAPSPGGNGWAFLSGEIQGMHLTLSLCVLVPQL